VFKSSGKSIVIISDQSDSTADSGQPTSDIDFILISTLSLDWIGISIWLIFGVSALVTSSIAQVYSPVEVLYCLFLASVLNSVQLENEALLWESVIVNVSTGASLPSLLVYLYCILNCTISCGLVPVVTTELGIVQKPLTLNLGATLFFGSLDKSITSWVTDASNLLLLSFFLFIF